MRARGNLAVFGFFLAIAIIFTAPLSLGPHERAANDGDPLHMAWITAWDAHQLASDPLHLFDSNSFFPYPSSLAFSDHLIGLALMGAPLYFLTGNALLAQNVALVVALALGALGMTLLVKELFGRADAAVVAGVIYVFHAYTFQEIPRAQLLSTQWLPFLLLYLHRTFISGGRKNAVLVAVFFTLQGLACIYYLFYSALVLALWIPTYLLFVPGARRRLAGLILPMAAAGAFFVVLALPYLRMVQQFDFQRALAEGSDLVSYVRPPADSVWALMVSFDFAPGVAPQFLGFVALGLALVGIVTRPGVADRPRRVFFWLTIATAATGLVLSLGPNVRVLDTVWGTGPYTFLYEHVPFFRALRNAERIGILVRFGFAVAAGLGAHTLFSRLSGRALTLARIGLVVILPFEHFSGGQPYVTVPTGERIPEVYRWLETTDEGAPVVELPLFPRTQLRRHALYMYYSTTHWRPIVFGRTSFYPPLTGYLAWELRDFPSSDSIALLEGLGVERIVVHPNLWSPEARREKLAALRRFSDRLEPEATFPDLTGDDYEMYGLGGERVYKLTHSGAVPPTESLCEPIDEIDPAAWELSGDAATPHGWAVDRDPTTKWRTDRQLPGIKLAVDLGRDETIAAVRVQLGYPHDNFPRDLTLKVRESGAGKRFERVFQQGGVETKWELVDELVNDPRNASMTLRFEPVRARRLRFWIREGKGFDYALPDWTMPELHIYRGCD